MFSLYFTDWYSKGVPIANGQAILDSLSDKIYRTNTGKKPIGKHFFNKSEFEQMCRISGNKYTYVDTFVDNFIFLIGYELDTPGSKNRHYKHWENLLVPLSSILTTKIITAINTKGYLVFTDNEGWLQMPDILRQQAISLGVNPNKIIYITADPNSNSLRDIYWNYQEEYCFCKVIEENKYSTVKDISNIKPTVLFTSLVGTANPSKIEFLNKIIDNNLFMDGKISLIKVKDRYKKLLNNDLLKKHPIIIDSSLDYFPKFTNTLTLGASSYINIVHSSDTQYEPYMPSIVVSNNDLFTSVICKRPFIPVCSSINKLEYVKQLGYKTFNSYFDENYDNIEDKHHRIDTIINLLKDLKTTDLDKLLLSMQDTLDYNFNHFFRKTNRSSHIAVKKLNEIINAD